MKVLQFTIPVAHDKTIIAEQVDLPYHYPYLHRHNEIQITWIKQGEGTLIAGNNMHYYSPGDVFLLGANLPHLFKSDPEYFEADSTKRIRAFSLFFDPEGVLGPLFDLPEIKYLKQFLQQHRQGFKIPVFDADKIKPAMTALGKASGADQLIQFLEFLKRLHHITEPLLPLSSYGKLPGITDNEGIRIGNIYNFIMLNYNEDITLEDVAKAAFMTPESFCRYFKKHTGHTFIAFLNDVRVNEACKMLTSNQFGNISQVAYKCGFKSITNFNRVFKVVTGSSPTAYVDVYSGKVLV